MKKNRRNTGAMKITWVYTFLLLLLLSCLNCEASIILGVDSVSVVPTRTVNYLSDGVEVSYTFPTVELREDDLYPSSKIPTIIGMGQNWTVGEPLYLVHDDLLVVPSDATPSVSLIDSTYVDYLYHLSPARPLLDDYGYEVYSLENVDSIADFSGFFLSSPILLGTPQIYRNNKMVNVSVFPLNYNKETGTIRVYHSLKYKLNYSAQIEEVTNFTEESRDGILRNLVINPHCLKTEVNLVTEEDADDFVDDDDIMPLDDGATSSFEKAPTMLIITTTSLLPAAQRLCEAKKLLGVKTQIITIGVLGATAIKKLIQEAYDDYKVEYLLILGTNTQVCGNNHYDSNFKKSYVSDYEYACMDGNNDDTADIFRGRIPVSNLSEADLIVDKIINYEYDPPRLNSFYNKAIHCAFFQTTTSKPTIEARRFVLTSEEIRDHLMAQGKTIDRIYKARSYSSPLTWNTGNYANGDSIPMELRKPNFLWAGNANEILSAINEGVFYVLHRDHGDTNCWGDPSFTTEHISQLQNGNLLPVVFSMNCLTGAYFLGEECFIEALLKHDNGGCVAAFGATRESYSGVNDVLACGMFEAIYPSPKLSPQFRYGFLEDYTTPTPTPTYRLGQVLDQGLLRLSETYPKDRSQSVKETKLIFHCFGDPSMRIYTEMPTSIEGVDIARYDTYLRVISPEALTITMYDYVNDKTYASIGTDHLLRTNHPENYVISVSGHNRVPYVETITNVCLSDSSIYAPSSHNNQLAIRTWGEMNDSSVVVVTNPLTESSITKSISLIDGHNGTINLSSTDLTSIGLNDGDIFYVDMSNVTYVVPVTQRHATLEFRLNDNLDGWYTSPDQNISDLSQEVTFYFNEPIYVENIRISSQDDFDTKEEDIYAGYSLGDSLSVSLRYSNLALSTISPQVTISLENLKDNKGFKFPQYSWINKTFNLNYASGAELLSIVPDPCSTTYEQLSDFNSVCFCFSGRVLFSSEYGARLILNDTYTDIIYMDQLLSTSVDIEFISEDVCQVRVMIPSMSTVNPLNVAIENFSVILENLTDGINALSPQPSAIYYPSQTRTIYQRSLGSVSEDGETEDLIFDIMGRRINATIDELPAGYYIVNGEKLIIY